MRVHTFVNTFIHMLVSLHVLGTFAKPQTGQQDGPCIGMDCLHGVLMHNDGDQGQEHVAEDQYLRFKSQLETGGSQIGPQDAETQLHGALMHGDSEHGKQHDQDNEDILPQQIPQAGPQDLNEMVHKGMHAESSVHRHDWDEVSDNIVVDQKGPMDSDMLMHGVLMHGDANYVHDNDDATEITGGDATETAGPLDAERYMHGVLMHGDAEQGKAHAHDHSSTEDSGEESGKAIGPNGDSLHGILMHGDASVGHDHSEEDSSAKHEVFSDLSKIREIVQDEALLKMIDLEKLLQNDIKEYSDWVKENPNHQDDSVMGSTYASVSDSILNDMELMKKKYLVRINENTAEDSFPPRKDDPKDIPFSADDANSVLEGHVHADDGEGVNHDLELLGSTEPLNARHKVKLALEKSKADDK